MKKRTKLTIAGVSLLAGALLLTGCTASFCSPKDKAHILYAFDYGVSDYYDHEVENSEQVFAGNTNIYYVVNVPSSTSSGIGKTKKDAGTANLQTPSNNYFVHMDKLVLENALKQDNPSIDFTTVTFAEAINALDKYGYLKYSGDNLWDNWTALNKQLKEMTVDPANGISLDDLPTNDYLTLYKKDMNSLISSYRSCIAITEDDYGYYGYVNGAQYRDADKVSVTIEEFISFL